MSSPGALNLAPLQPVRLSKSAVSGGISHNERIYLLASLTGGMLLGLSVPGFEQWYIAWFGLVPLLALTVSAREPWVALWRGWAFGTGMNLVCLSWVLAIQPVFLLGPLAGSPTLMLLITWVIMALNQGLLVGIFSCLSRAVPMCGGWLPGRRGTQWTLPSFIVMPILWVLVVDKLGNLPELLGLPWSSLQYSQYKQLPLLQSASLIGGIGIGALIMLVNAALVSILGSNRSELATVSIPTRKSLLVHCAVVLALVSSLFAFGKVRLEQEQRLSSSKNLLTVSALQANLVHRVHNTNSLDIARKYIKLSAGCAPGLCVWPEWSLVCNFSQNRDSLKFIGAIARQRGQSWICGTFDDDAQGRIYNSVCGIDKNGTILPGAYRKRWLVPFGEYTPDWARQSVIGLLLYGLNSGFEETAAGNSPVVLKLQEVTAGPILCFENLYPALVADTVRSGANLIVDCSNTSWFHKSVLSDQMVAFSAMRAVENHRSFVFATAIGPSTIIDSDGRIKIQAPANTAAAISAVVPIENDRTAFTQWCF